MLTTFAARVVSKRGGNGRRDTNLGETYIKLSLSIKLSFYDGFKNVKMLWLAEQLRALSLIDGVTTTTTTTTTTTLFTLVHICINKHWKELKKGTIIESGG